MQNMRNLKIQLVLVLILCFGIGWEKGVAAVPNERKSAPAHKPRIQDLQRATFAGGCFWGIEHNFRRIPGVEKTAVGFMGGRTKNPSWRLIQMKSAMSNWSASFLSCTIRRH
jgi:hypothetical protein